MACEGFSREEEMTPGTWWLVGARAQTALAGAWISMSALESMRVAVWMSPMTAAWRGESFASSAWTCCVEVSMAMQTNWVSAAARRAAVVNEKKRAATAPQFLLRPCRSRVLSPAVADVLSNT